MHVHDGVSIPMLEMNSCSKPLSMIFRNWFQTGCLPLIKKEATFAHLNKKWNFSTNYQLASLLLISGKTFEKIKFNTLSHYFTENNLLNFSQSDVIPGALWVHQPISITHERLELYSQMYLKHFITYGIRGFFIR